MKLANIGTKIETLDLLDKISPIDGKTIYKIPLSRKPEIDDIFVNAQNSRQELFDIGIFNRTKLLELAIDNLLKTRQEIIELVIKETGKSRKLSESEFDTAILFGKSLLGLARFQDGITIPSSDPKKFAYEKRIPFGVAGLIVSYNTPMPNYAWKVFPSFLSGNVSILKPSPHTSGSAQLFVGAFDGIGAPNNSVCLLHGDNETGKILSELELDLLSFTGSYKAGLNIQENTANKMRKNIFELGGNNCLIISKNANIEKAIYAVLNSAFSNSGQRCAAGSRVLIHSEISEEFLEKLKQELINIKVGIDDDAFLGPIIDLEAVSRYKEFVKICGEENLQVTQSKISENLNQYYIAPTLIEGFLENNSLFSTEVFAPILRVATFEDNQGALRLANNSKYSLTAAIWSENLHEINFFVNRLNAGLVNVNGPTHGAEFQFPFGGTGFSGNGTKEVGLQCLDQYSHHKLITITNHG